MPLSKMDLKLNLDLSKIGQVHKKHTSEEKENTKKTKMAAVISR